MDRDEIKQHVSIGWVLDHWGIRANRAGKILCPFHNDNNPSCQIYYKTNSFYCFSCGKGGDIFTLVMGLDNCTFSEAFQKLGGTYIGQKGKSRMQIRRAVRDQAEKARQKKEPETPALDLSERYETILKTFPPDSTEYLLASYYLTRDKLREAGKENR